MYRTRFYTLFAACTETEISGFYKRLKQTHSRRIDMLRLFAYIQKVSKDPDAEAKLNMAFGYHKIFKKDIGKDRKNISNTLSDLYRLLREYLLSEKIKSDVSESRSLWLSILTEKGLDEEFSRQALAHLNEYERSPGKSFNDYLNLMILRHQYYYNYINNSETDGFIQIQKSARVLEMYSRLIKLRMLCEVIPLKTLLPAEYAVEEFIESLKQTESEVLSGHPLPFLYSELRMLLETNDLRQFNKLTDAISEHALKISGKELEELLLYLHNFLSAINRSSKTGEDNARAHYINKIALQYNVYIRKGEIRIGHFLNIVNIACRVKDFDWVAQFISTCQNLLPEWLRTDAVKLSKAIVKLEKKEFSNVLKILQGIHSKNVYIQIRIRLMMIICYFELGDSEVDLFDFCTNSELYLKRNGRPLKDAVSSALNFIKIVRILLRRRVSQQKILEEINNTTLLSFRHWLLEKAGKYENR